MGYVVGMTTVKFDEWQEVVNDAATFTALALDLKERGSVIIGWTDEHHSHHDVLFTLAPKQHGNLQGGMRGSRHLFVSIMRRGCFGFYIVDSQLHPSYVSEKLGDHPDNPTCIALTVLLNGVIHALTS